MSAKERVSATLEDYLEAILKLDSDKGSARVRDIAAELSVHKSTVSAALKNLTEKGLINYSPYEIATLTEQGRKIAESVVQSHSVIKRFLADVLLIADSEAGENACRMEHVVDRKVVDRLALLAGFIKKRRYSSSNWSEKFVEYIEECEEYSKS